jgi:ethanolamine utilization protein EutN
VNLGKIMGTVVATRKDPSLMGVRLLLLQPLTDKLEKIGDIIVAADPMGARPGDVVMWVASREASLALENKFAPVDAAVVGLVDHVGGKSMEPDLISGSNDMTWAER